MSTDVRQRLHQDVRGLPRPDQGGGLGALLESFDASVISLVITVLIVICCMRAKTITRAHGAPPAGAAGDAALPGQPAPRTGFFAAVLVYCLGAGITGIVTAALLLAAMRQLFAAEGTEKLPGATRLVAALTGTGARTPCIAPSAPWSPVRRRALAFPLTLAAMFGALFHGASSEAASALFGYRGRMAGICAAAPRGLGRLSRAVPAGVRRTCPITRLAAPFLLGALLAVQAALIALLPPLAVAAIAAIVAARLTPSAPRGSARAGIAGVT